MTIKERIDQLRDQLHRYNYAYYMEDKSLVSDLEFDQLLKELQGLETAHPEFNDPHSPTQRVGGALLRIFLRLFMLNVCIHWTIHIRQKNWAIGLSELKNAMDLQSMSLPVN